jgi:rhamnosyltransferase
MEAFEKCGLFQEDLFIYCVDDDYSLRIRKNGFFIGVSTSAVLLHQSGHPTSRKLFGMTLTTKNYRPEVRYYYARNKVWILRFYGKTFPRLIVPTLREFVTIPLKIVLMEDAPWRKMKLFIRGLADGVFGRMGRLRQAE